MIFYPTSMPPTYASTLEVQRVKSRCGLFCFKCLFIMILNEKSKGILSKSVKLLYLFKDKGWVKCLIDLKKRFENIYIKK